MMAAKLIESMILKVRGRSDVMSVKIPSASAKCDWKDCSNIGKDKCEGCGIARYCSRECQLKDWKCAANPHKIMCKILKGRRDTSGGTFSALNAADAGANESMSAMIPSGSNEMHAKCDWKDCSNIGKDRCGGCGIARYCSRE